MIVVKLMGGLGNQMFQYAFARNLSIKNNTGLKADLNFLLDRTPRENFVFRDYDLDIFNLKLEVATQGDLKLFDHSSELLLEKIYYKVARSIISPEKIIEKQFNFNPQNISTSKSLYLDGYWQSEKYFNENREQIINDFSFRKPPNDYYSTILEQVDNTNSVAVHFRRGDYVNNPLTSKYHGLCSIDYYKKAMNYFEQKFEGTHFYMISDDIEWVKQYFSENKNCTFIENNKGELCEDLRLMTMCKHNIIANSSFSWWGAYLNSNSEKIVIAPKQWFADTKLQNQTQDIIPPSWIRI